jgi:hypothetical protein
MSNRIMKYKNSYIQHVDRETFTNIKNLYYTSRIQEPNTTCKNLGRPETQRANKRPNCLNARW